MPRPPAVLASPFVLLSAAPLFWAGNLVIARAVRGEIPPLSINWWRWAIAAAILTAVVRGGLWRQRHLLLRHWKLLGLLALTGIVGFHSAVYVGLTMTTTTNGALIIAMGPVLIVPLARVLLGERITGLQGLGVALSSLGAVAVIARGDPQVLLNLEVNGGDLWLLFASVCWAVYSVLLKRKPPQVEVMVLLTAILLLGVALSTPLYLWELSRGLFIPLAGQSLAAIGYVGVFAGALAYIAWNGGVNAVGPNRAGLFLHLIPVYSVALAAVFLGERLHGYHLAGVALIVAGLLLTSRYGAPASTRAVSSSAETR